MIIMPKAVAQAMANPRALMVQLLSNSMPIVLKAAFQMMKPLAKMRSCVAPAEVMSESKMASQTVVPVTAVMQSVFQVVITMRAVMAAVGMRTGRKHLRGQHKPRRREHHADQTMQTIQISRKTKHGHLRGIICDAGRVREAATTRSQAVAAALRLLLPVFNTHSSRFCSTTSRRKAAKWIESQYPDPAAPAHNLAAAKPGETVNRCRLPAAERSADARNAHATTFVRVGMPGEQFGVSTGFART